MKVLIIIIYFLLVILFLLCFYFFQKENRILEGGIGITMDQSKFGQNIGNLILVNKNLEISLDKINNTVGELNNKNDIKDANQIKINDLNKTLSESQSAADNLYLQIKKRVEPIVFLRLDNNIKNDLTSIDGKINGILDTTPYKEINVYPNNLNPTSKYGKKCLHLSGIGKQQGVDFGIIPTLKQITFSFWIYNDNVTNIEPVISIMNKTDFDNNVAKSGVKVYINKEPNIVEVYYNDKTLRNTMNNGWNHITFSSGVANACLYINGDIRYNTCGDKVDYINPTIIDSYDTKYRTNIYFTIGRTKFKGYIYNVRYYAIEIPTSTITNIYNVDIATTSSNA